MSLTSQHQPVNPDARHARLCDRYKLHPDIVKLGWVSFLTDLSSEMIFAVFAVFFTTIAGAPVALLGLVEGMADFSAASLSYWSGRWSDRSGKRKVFALGGYAFSTLAKTLLLVSTSVAALGVFRVVERLGKGFRGPPRDAWLATLSDPSRRGLSFGIHKALDKAGAVLGPLLAYGLLRWTAESAAGYQTLFWIAVVPALLSMGLLASVTDPVGAPQAQESVVHNWQSLSPDFKRFMLPAGIFALGYYSLGFLLVKAHALGLGTTDIVLLYAGFNLSCVVCAPMVGWLADRIGRRRVVLLGYALYGLINLGAWFVDSAGGLVLLFAVYGGFYAIEESQTKAFIADLEPQRRATAIGVYGFFTGLLCLPASLLAGALWALAPGYAFAAAATLSLAAIMLLSRWRPAKR